MVVLRSARHSTLTLHRHQQDPQCGPHLLTVNRGAGGRANGPSHAPAPPGRCGSSSSPHQAPCCVGGMQDRWACHAERTSTAATPPSSLLLGLVQPGPIHVHHTAPTSPPGNITNGSHRPGCTPAHTPRQLGDPRLQLLGHTPRPARQTPAYAFSLYQQCPHLAKPEPLMPRQARHSGSRCGKRIFVQHRHNSNFEVITSTLQPGGFFVRDWQPTIWLAASLNF